MSHPRTGPCTASRTEASRIRNGTNVLEQFFAGPQQEEAAEDSAEDRRREDPPQAARLPAQVVPLRQRASEIAGAQRHGVGHVRDHGRDSQRGEHGEGDERAAARQCIDGSRRHRGQPDEQKIDSGEHEVRRVLEVE